jgi:hypothetical protein
MKDSYEEIKNCGVPLLLFYFRVAADLPDAQAQKKSAAPDFAGTADLKKLCLEKA